MITHVERITPIFKLNLCDYSDAYILVSRTIPNKGTAAAPNNEKNIIIKNCAPFTDGESEVNKNR